MSVNRSLTFIDTEQTVNTATSKLSVSSESYYTVTEMNLARLLKGSYEMC